MFPTWDLGPWHIHTFDTLQVLALIIGVTYSSHRLLRLDIPENLINRILLLTILGGGAGALLVRAIPTLRHFILTGTLAWARGSSFTGALIGGISVAVICCRKCQIPLGQAFDLGGLPVPLSQAIGRVGCFAAGCCYGRATDSWLGMRLPDSRGEWMVRYPTQLMSAAIDLLIFIGLLALERYRKRWMKKGGVSLSPSWLFDGSLFLLYVDLYCLKRLVMEFLRGDATLIIGAISWVHIFSVSGIVTATAFIVWNLRRPPHSESSIQRSRGYFQSGPF